MKSVRKEIQVDYSKVLESHINFTEKLTKNVLVHNHINTLRDKSEEDKKYICLSNILQDEMYGYSNFLGFLLLISNHEEINFVIKKIKKEREIYESFL